jgi:hypothetical protein
MFNPQAPRFESQSLIQFRELTQAPNFLKAISQPFEIASLLYKLLLKDVKQIVTLITTCCHDPQE